MFFGKRLGSSVLFVLTFVLAGGARADLLIGGYRGVGTPAPVLRFTESANGNVAPNGSFYTNPGGGTEAMASALCMIYEPVERAVYVADFMGQAIRVYAAGAASIPPCNRVVWKLRHSH